MCKDGGQKRAIRMSKIDGREVQCTLARSRKLVKGVVTGILVRVSDDDTKENVTVSDAKCLKTNKNGIKFDSLSVLITFDEERLLEDIHWVYVL